MEKGGHLVLLLLVCLGLCSGQPESTDSNEIPAPRTTADPRCMSALGVTTMAGVQTANQTGSRVDYIVMKEIPSVAFKDKTTVSVEFRTMSRSGLLLLIHSPASPDWVGVFNYKGFLRYSFSCGMALTNARLTYRGRPINRGKWHKLSLHRKADKISLEIDGVTPFKEYSTHCRELSTISIGGADKMGNRILRRQGFEEGVTPHSTCFRNFRQLYDERDVTSPTQAMYHAVSSCIWQTE